MNRVNFKNVKNPSFHFTPKDIRNISKVKPVKTKPIYYSGFDEYTLDQILKEPIKQVSKSLDLEIIKDPTGYQHSRGFRGNHSHLCIKRPSGGELGITDSIGGCGMQQLYGWTGISTVEGGIQLIEKYLEMITPGVGLIICQVGRDYYGRPFEQALIHCGFTVLIEYSNLAHCRRGTYKQKIYKLEIKPSES